VDADPDAVGGHPEVTARTEQRAEAVDTEFAQLAEWIGQGRAPISAALAEYLVRKLATAQLAGCNVTRAWRPGVRQAECRDRRTRPDGSKRNLFIRIADALFDANNRLLASPRTTRWPSGGG
jgi:hypothetical protein